MVLWCLGKIANSLVLNTTTFILESVDSSTPAHTLWSIIQNDLLFHESVLFLVLAPVCIIFLFPNLLFYSLCLINPDHLFIEYFFKICSWIISSRKPSKRRHLDSSCDLMHLVHFSYSSVIISLLVFFPPLNYVRFKEKESIISTTAFQLPRNAPGLNIVDTK